MSKPLTTPLPLLSRRLAERTGGPAPSYRVCYRAIVDGLIPAEKVGREWHVADADLPMAERVLGLTKVAATPVAA